MYNIQPEGFLTKIKKAILKMYEEIRKQPTNSKDKIMGCKRQA
jgi:hypothetical protein